MPLKLETIAGNETLSLLPMLLEADEGEERIRGVLLDQTCTVYAAQIENQLVGATVVRWEENDTSEIVYIEVAAALRGRSYGKQMIQALQAELLRRGGHALLVGTANASLENIAFYQKCGFRMHKIKHDFFTYIQPPRFEHGIQIRDMLMLRYDP